MELPFDEEEVLPPLNSCGPDKAPGPDGYTMRFFQKSWEFIKTDVMDALKLFHQHGSMMRFYNASFIALVPKRKVHWKTTLQASYPRLYQIASNQDSFVSQYRDNNLCCPQFRRNLQDSEINDLLKLLATLAE